MQFLLAVALVACCFCIVHADLSGPAHIEERSHEEQDSGGDETGISANSLADVESYEEALDTHIRSLAIKETAYGKNHPRVGRALNNIGNIYHQLGRYEEALAAYARSLAIKEVAHGKNHPELGKTLNNMGVVYDRLGRYEEALAALTRVFQSGLGSHRPIVGMTLNNMGIVYDNLGRHEEALVAYSQALVVKEELYGKDHPTVGATLSNMGIALHKREQHEEAVAVHNRALAIQREAYGENHPTVGIMLNNLGSVYTDLQRYGEALAVLTHSLAILQPRPDGHLPYLREAYDSLSRLRALTDDRPGAILFAKQAVNIHQQIRARNPGLDERFAQSLSESGDHVYHHLADLLIDAGRLAEAQFVLDLVKEQEIFEFVRRDTSHGDPRTGRIALNGQERRSDQAIRDALARPLRLAAEFRMLQDKRDGEDLSDSERDRLTVLEDTLNEAYTAFVSQVDAILAAALDASRQVEREVRALDLDYTLDFQLELERFDGQAALLRIASLDETLHLFVTTPVISVSRQVQVPREDLAREVFEAIEAIEKRSPEATERLRTVYGRLIRPIEQDLRDSGAKVIMLSLDGFLRYVPFAALHSGDRYLIEDYALAMHTPAARTRYETWIRDRGAGAGFGVTRAHPDLGFSALPGVARELEAIFEGEDEQGLLAGAPRLDGAFSAESFATALEGRPQLVHVASHFRFLPGDENQSFLLLGDGSPLSLAAFRKRRGFALRGVELLTLSACATARGDAAKGAEIESFGALAQKSGAGAVLATLWPVEDASTARLMGWFYDGLLSAGLDKAHALRQAQLRLLGAADTPGPAASGDRGALSIDGGPPVPATLSDPRHPYYWAPFLLMGNWL